MNTNEPPLPVQPESQAQNVLTDNNPRRKQQGILSLTQDKAKTCAKPAIELEIKLYQNFSWCRMDHFLQKNIKTFPLLAQLAKAIHITIRGCYIKKTEIKCDCLYKLFSTHMSS